MFVWTATTGAVPVMLYDVPTAGAGNETETVPVGIKQVGCAVTLAKGAAGFAGTAFIDNNVPEETQPLTVVITV